MQSDSHAAENYIAHLEQLAAAYQAWELCGRETLGARFVRLLREWQNACIHARPYPTTLDIFGLETQMMTMSVRECLPSLKRSVLQ